MSKWKVWSLRVLVSVFLLFLLALFLDYLKPSVDPELYDKLVQASAGEAEQIIDSERQRFGITALSVTEIVADGEPKSLHFGRAEEGGLMQVASLSKAVAAAVVLTVAEERGVGLDDDIRAQITSLDISALQGGQRPVTLRQLLSHTSGASHSFYLGFAPDSGALPSTAQVINSPTRLYESQLEFEGESGEYLYSGGGFMVAQLWVEDVLDQPFAMVAKERILDPLGMSNSTFEQPASRSDYPALNLIGADAGFDPTEGVFRSVENGWNLYPEQAAAGLWSTSSDYALFVAAMMDGATGEGGIIPKAIAAAMIDPFVETGYDQGTHYGLGTMLNLNADGTLRDVSHGGANLGYRAYFIARPATSTSPQHVVVVLGNTASAARLNRVVATAFLDRQP